MIGQKHVPSREGGVEIVVWELARRLRDRGYSVECYNRSGYHMNARDYEKIKGLPGHYYSGIRILTIPTFRRRQAECDRLLHFRNDPCPVRTL